MFPTARALASVAARAAAVAGGAAGVGGVGDTMRALVKAERGRGLRLVRDAPVPRLGAHDALVAIRHTSLCGTDVHIYKDDPWSVATVPVPLTVGHEYMGEIVDLGAEAHASSPLRVGDRVTGEGHLTCGYCRNCRGGRQHLCRNAVGVGVHRAGAFADYLALPARNVVQLPRDVPDEWGAVMDPLGNAVHTALAFPDKLIGEDVLITGAGPIGIMAAGVCRQVGARHVVVTDVREERLELARRCGASLAINMVVPVAATAAAAAPDADLPAAAAADSVAAAAAATTAAPAAPPSAHTPLHAAMERLGMTEGFDVGLEMSGAPSAFRSMLAHMNHGGRIAMLGIPSTPFAIDWNELVFKGLSVRGIYGREMFETWYTMRNMMSAGLMQRIEPVITHRFPMEAYERAFETACGGVAGKIILDWRAR